MIIFNNQNTRKSKIFHDFFKMDPFTRCHITTRSWKVSQAEFSSTLNKESLTSLIYERHYLQSSIYLSPEEESPAPQFRAAFANWINEDVSQLFANNIPNVVWNWWDVEVFWSEDIVRFAYLGMYDFDDFLEYDGMKGWGGYSLDGLVIRFVYNFRLG